MTELLLILAVIFAAYILFGQQKEPQITTNSPANPVMPDKPAPVAAIKPATAPAISRTEKTPAKKPVATSTKAATASKPKTAASPKAKPALVPQMVERKGLKDPKTGEIAASYSNYRFTKRWIKEALVAEGLLDKVYKNDELNTEIETKIKNAIVKLEAIAKYQA